MSFLASLGSWTASLSPGWIRVVLALGCFFGWLLAFPLAGPTLGALASAGADPAGLVLAFGAGHALGLVLTALLLRPGRWLRVGSAGGAVGCAALTALVPQLPVSFLPAALAVLGLIAGPFPVAWGCVLTGQIDRRLRARTVAAGAFVANLILYGFNLLSFLTPAAPAMVVLTALFALVAAVVWFRGPSPALHRFGPGLRWPPALLGFIIAVYLIGGVLYGLIQPSFAGLALAPVFGLIPYLAGLPIAGFVADRIGRRPLGLLAPPLLGLAFPLFVLSRSEASYLVIQTLVMVGFACADVFTWTVLGDLGNGRAVQTFGLGLGVMVAAITLGFGAIQVLGGVSAQTQFTVGTLASGMLLVAGGLAGWLPETGCAAHRSAASAEDLARRLAGFGLTEREVEVVRGLLEGLDGPELCRRLHISANTLKVHIRNIYRKTGVNSRQELLWLALNAEAS